MRGLKQGVASLILGTLLAEADPGKAFAYQPPVVEKCLFDDSLSMFDRERVEYATNLATYAAKCVVEKGADAASLEQARRIIGLALHLSPRNRQALVVNFQLKQGVLPEVKKGDYNPRTLSRLLLSRARLLAQGENENGKLLAGCFVELAALIDPRNEDAVYAYEIQRLESGDVDWRLITEATQDGPSKARHPEGE